MSWLNPFGNDKPVHSKKPAFELLGINPNDWDSFEEGALKKEMSVYACVKYTYEHPTPWNIDDSVNSFDSGAFDEIVERGYVDKILPDEFPGHFEKFTVEELKAQSFSSLNWDISRNEVINVLMNEGEYSWVVNDKGINYLKSNLFLDFFTSHLIEFNVYEFKLFCDRYDGEMTLEKIGDKYIRLKLDDAFKNGEYYIYSNYLDYYYARYLKQKDYDTAIFLSTSETDL